MITSPISRPITSRIASAIAGARVGGAANPLVWHAAYPDADGVMQAQLIGSGTPTFNVDAGLLLPDFEGIYRTTAEDTAPWHGARKVTNLLRYSDDLTITGGTGWTAVGTASTSDNGDGSFQVTLGGSGQANRLQAPTVSGVSGDSVIYSIYLKAGSISEVTIRLQDNISPYTSSTATLTLTSEWQRFSIARTGSVASLTAILGHLYSTTAGTIHAKQAQYEVVTGQADTTNPSEYVPTTSAAASKYFSYENGNTVSSNVVSSAQGATLDPLPSLYGAPAYTQKALYSNDHSNAAWVKSNMTAAKDATGLTGAPNTGSTLTATGANATCIQTVTSPAGDHVARFFLRRKTGTGTVEICCDGSTWSSVTLTSAYQEFMVLANTTNPQIGVRIVTSGDAVEVGNGECYA